MNILGEQIFYQILLTVVRRDEEPYTKLFKGISSKRDRLFSDYEIHSSSNAQLQGCVELCNIDYRTLCMSFAWNRNGGACKLYNSTSEEGVILEQGWRHYEDACPESYHYVQEFRSCLSDVFGPETWIAANETCFNESSVLVRLDTAQKDQYVTKLMVKQSVPNLWIQGMFVDGKWIYNDGTEMNTLYTNWYQSPSDIEPDNDPATPAVFISGTWGNTWIDTGPGTSNIYYICESKIDRNDFFSHL